VGATTAAALVNTAYLLGLSALLVSTVGTGDLLPLDQSLQTLPRAWGVFLDLTVLSFVGPLNEEFWKGLLVGLFFFRRGDRARCFLWGVLAGSGFNLLETFQNSLVAVDPRALAEQTIGPGWWFFASVRGGTAAMHGLASGLAALGFYGLLRRKPRYLIGYPAGAGLHATWNFLVYVVWGNGMLSRAWPSSTALAVIGGGALVLLVLVVLGLLWSVTSGLDEERGGIPSRWSGDAALASEETPP
jgi:hypothetical protein